MKLIDALQIISKPGDGDPVNIGLVCGFTPLHLQTFLHAETQLLFPEHRVEIVTGLYGDVGGSLRDARMRTVDTVALILEWEDLDQRLGMRHVGGWHRGAVDDVLDVTQLKLSSFEQALAELSVTRPVVVSLPTLPLPPVFVNAPWESGTQESHLRERVASFAASITRNPRIRLLNEQRMHAVSPWAERFSVKSYLASGFPYTLQHASALAALMARSIKNPSPKKGLITDLDNTLWSGIVGEVGIEAIHWDLDRKSQTHGLYQQFLRLLAEEGVLIGVASKNDSAIVEQAFKREDLLLTSDQIFPFEVSWGSKAKAVERILSAWNIAADSVVLVDDSPLELAEVKSAYPQIECLQFFPEDPQAVYELLVKLREMFGKRVVTAEDELRLDSIRKSTALKGSEPSTEEGFSEALLEQAGAQLVFSLRKDANDLRAFELMNKTNQFNLNGRRFSESSWQEYLAASDRFLLTATYTDRFGSLGKIAVIAGRENGSGLVVDSWVMSCRAFARRIEHQCLKFLFDKFQSKTITLEYQPTARNGPLASFLERDLKRVPEQRLELTEEHFRKICPRLFHEVRESD